MVDSNEQERRAKEIFDVAVELGPDRRDEYLREVCAGDTGLRARVEALLAVDEGQTPFVERIIDAASEAVRADGEARLVGASVGPYELVRLIASGGMGEVYEARQRQPIERRVAVKLIKPGLGSREVIQRFEAERQVLSLMSHAGIARVFDAGTAGDGRPYFVMELVEGVAIDRHCDREELAIPERLELFLAVCDAVQHAHRRGIVHRDLKPSNILVSQGDGGPSAAPKVIDFGIAKALDPSLAGAAETQLGTTLGTPDYMSPEQAGLPRDIDTRTDVYALGVLLYELIAGSRPLPGRRQGTTGIEEAKRIVREEEPESLTARIARLSPDDEILGRRRTSREALVRQARGDLEWICARALQKEPDERFGSVGELAADVARHLADEPVLAGPPSTVYRLRKLARRHRLAAAAAALVLLGLLVGVAGLGVGMQRARVAQAHAEEEAERTSHVASFLSQMVSSLDARDMGGAIVDKVLAAANGEPGGEADLERLLRGINRADVARQIVAEQVLERASQTLDDQYADDPEVRARLLVTIAQAYGNLSLYDRAEQEIRRAVDLQMQTHGPLHAETLRARSYLGNVLKTLGRFDESRRLHEDVLEKRREVLGELHEETISSLDNLGMIASGLRDDRLAYEVFQEAYDKKLQVFGPQAPDTIRQAYALGVVSGNLHRYEQARQLLERAVEGFRAELGEDDAATLNARRSLADVLAHTGRFAEAQELLAEVHRRTAAAFGDQDARTLVIRDFIAYGYTLAGSFAEAETIYREIAPQYARLLGDDHPAALAARANVGRCLAHLGRPAEAEEILRLAMAELLRHYQPSDPQAWAYAAHLALALEQRGLHREAIEELRRVIGYAEATGDATAPSDDPDLLGYRRQLARALLALADDGALAEALELLESLEPSHRQLFGDDHFETARTRLLLADARLVAAASRGDAAPRRGGDRGHGWRDRGPRERLRAGHLRRLRRLSAARGRARGCRRPRSGAGTGGAGRGCRCRLATPARPSGIRRAEERCALFGTPHAERSRSGRRRLIRRSMLDVAGLGSLLRRD